MGVVKNFIHYSRFFDENLVSGSKQRCSVKQNLMSKVKQDLSIIMIEKLIGDLLYKKSSQSLGWKRINGAPPTELNASDIQ